jgi:hypothetical protein
MTDSNGSAIHMRSGVMAGPIPQPKWLRFCPLCVADDAKRFRETYWHRLHQLPGVEVCPVHAVFLENNGARRESQNPYQFQLAEKFTQASVAQALNKSDPDHIVLLKIAVDAAWLLNQADLTTTLEGLRNRYLALFIERGLASYSGCIRAGELLSKFKEYYSPSLLKLLRCQFRGRDKIKDNWLLHLVRKPKHAHHPIYHLLLIYFFGISAEKFFALPEEIKFFGDLPWPCLNPAANHYKRPVIVEFQSGKRLRDNKPIGIFSCECGFAFARTGPDSTPEDRFRIGRMISFGPVWEAKLKELWKDSSLSLSEVGRRLGVDPLTVRRHATRLKLSFSRSGRSSKLLKSASQLKGQHTSKAWEEKRRAYRTKWLSALRRTSNIKLKALRQRLPRVYAWLQQNDFGWLIDHSAQSKRHIQSTSSVDWQKRDAEYAVGIRAAASRIKNAPGRPVQVTKTAIGRSIGAITLLQQKLNKMPLSAQVLASVVETRIEYAIRRIWWVVNLYLEENLLPQVWQLIMRANIYRLREETEIKETVEIAIREIASALSPNERARVVS